LSGPLDFGCVVLLLGVVVRAVVKQLRVDFHEQFHGIVYHSMDRSVVC
jgi:hypothetical protein